MKKTKTGHRQEVTLGHFESLYVSRRSTPKTGLATLYRLIQSKAVFYLIATLYTISSLKVEIGSYNKQQSIYDCRDRRIDTAGNCRESVKDKSENERPESARTKKRIIWCHSDFVY